MDSDKCRAQVRRLEVVDMGSAATLIGR